MKKKVTIQDIADALGISRNTVSKAINNADGLADATRERILQKAVEMGYKQFSYVSAMTQGGAAVGTERAAPPGAANEIALFTTVFLTQSHFSSLMLDKLQRDLSQLGYTLNTHRLTEPGQLPPTFDRERTAGIICVEVFDWAYVEAVCALDIPVLFVDGPANPDGRPLPADQLYMDNRTGVTRFVRDMLRQGKRRIGFIGDYMHCQSFFERYTALRCALALADVPAEDRFVLRTHSVDELRELLPAMAELPEVFLCANDFVAWDAAHILKSMGKDIPGDVYVCGFDDAPESRAMIPPLTTIHIHTQIMAFSAMQLLMARIKEPSLDYRIVHTETELIYRASTGDAPAGGEEA